MDAVSEKVDDLLDKVDVRLKAAEALAESRHQQLLAKLETSNTIYTARYESIMMKALDIDKRLEPSSEGSGKRLSQPSGETDASEKPRPEMAGGLFRLWRKGKH